MALSDYVKNVGLRFVYTPSRRKATKGIVLHHPAMYTATPEQIHQLHLNRGWIGAGYNFLVRKDGTVYELRPHWAVGAHAASKVSGVGVANNSETIGICFEGYFHPRGNGSFDKEMSKAQFDAGVRLIKDLIKEYPDIEYIRGHKEMPGTSTACPGKYFPLEEMKSAVKIQNGGKGDMLLKKGMKGTEVKELQQQLIDLGYILRNYGADGVFGNETERAVMAFQKDRGITVDGIVGPYTRNHLEAALQAQKVSDADKKLAEAKKLAQKILDL